jgi:hypothetical protein
MEYINVTPKKPGNIALSFSGGGFRAASYTLGCLSYMETVMLGDKKLTELVNFISSASGGTITNLAYTSSQRKGESFDAFYKRYNEKTLQGCELINRVFEIMNERRTWKQRPLKSRNMINAFSIAYDEMLFDHETFGVYYKNYAPGMVKEVCANTTEFDNGMLFRFQNAGVAGNKFLGFRSDSESKQVLNQIKLGDILACSSCFPVGFEPFMFPADFTYQELSKEGLENAIKEDTRYSPAKDDAVSSEPEPPCFGLMDGGIDDNQGIDSFIRAEERLQNKNNFGHDLYIACDVSSNYTSGYNFPAENKKSILQRPSVLQYILFLLLILGLSITGICTATCAALINLSYVFLGITSFLLAFVILFSIKGFKAYRSSIKQKNTYGILLLGHIFFFLKLRLSNLLQLLTSRATSAGQLAAVVFLKKIRRISYDRLFEKVTERKLEADGKEPGNNEDELATKVELKHWRQFSLQNALYLLSTKNDQQREIDLKKEAWYKNDPAVIINGVEVKLIDLMKPSPALQAVANCATEMDTTLWFDKNHYEKNQPAALIAAGQFTTCYNLLKYSFRFDSADPYWKTLQTKLAADWDEFNKHPYCLYNKYGARVIANFKSL